VSKDKLGRRREKPVENPGGMRNAILGILAWAACACFHKKKQDKFDTECRMNTSK